MVSRQRKIQIEQQKQGNCIICFQPRNKFKQRCDDCTEKQRIQQRKRDNCKPYKLGQRGCPPKEFVNKARKFRLIKQLNEIRTEINKHWPHNKIVIDSLIDQINALED